MVTAVTLERGNRNLFKSLQINFWLKFCNSFKPSLLSMGAAFTMGLLGFVLEVPLIDYCSDEIIPIKKSFLHWLHWEGTQDV